jgi:hypothetical protein
MINLLDSQFKKVLLDKWKSEVVYNQRVLFGLAEEFLNIQYYDKELWLKIAETAIGKKKINNSHYWQTIHSCLTKLNADKESGLQGVFTDHLTKLVEKHYSADRKWRYNIETAEMRSLQELIDRRDDCV